MLQLSCLSSLGFLEAGGVADCDGSCVLDGGGPCLLHSGLCCPADSLDDTVVIEFINNEELLEDLAIAASLPPGTELLLPAAEHWCQGVSSGDGAPRLPVRSPLSSGSNSSWTTWHRTSSLAAEPPPPSPPAVSRLVVPKRKRDRSVVRGRRPWSLDMPNIPTPHAANPSSSGGSEVVRQQGLVPRPPTNRRRVQRACSHCDSTETPQWRAGPDGPGTLCNACGLRYSLNKLLPEYRPSTSPSFQSDQHSNRHRKVVKLRERNAKDTVVSMPPAPPGDGGEFMDHL
ncbi:GATA transcription factor 1-like [Miscanthus floridulus]|uniref:GATA transcription factor 1-like n=1 Tax=Miscanthus floridulus TaxID=154761 RepID=UPI0034577C56